MDWFVVSIGGVRSWRSWLHPLFQCSKGGGVVCLRVVLISVLAHEVLKKAAIRKILSASLDNGRIMILLEQKPVHSPSAADERVGVSTPTPFTPGI